MMEGETVVRTGRQLAWSSARRWTATLVRTRKSIFSTSTSPVSSRTSCCCVNRGARPRHVSSIIARTLSSVVTTLSQCTVGASARQPLHRVLRARHMHTPACLAGIVVNPGCLVPQVLDERGTNRAFDGLGCRHHLGLVLFFPLIAVDLHAGADTVPVPTNHSLNATAAKTVQFSMQPWYVISFGGVATFCRHQSRWRSSIPTQRRPHAQPTCSQQSKGTSRRSTSMNMAAGTGQHRVVAARAVVAATRSVALLVRRTVSMS